MLKTTIRRTIKINYDKGIHTRVAAAIIQKVTSLEKKYNVTFSIVSKKQTKISASSMMMLLGLKIKKNDMLTVEATGENVEIALDELEKFMQGDFDIIDKNVIYQIDKIIDENSITLEQIVNSMANGVIAIDENEKITVLNEVARRILDISSEDVIGKSLSVAIPDSKLGQIKKIDQYEIGYKVKIGNSTVITNRTPIVIDGKFKGAVAIFEDISNIEKITEELTQVKELKEKLQLILESVEDGICVLDKDGYINYVNESYLKIVKQSKSEILSKHISQISPNGARAKSLRTGKKIIGYISKKTNGITIVSNVSPIIVDKEVYGVVSVVKNITQIQDLYEKLSIISDKATYFEEELIRTKKSFNGFEKFKGVSGKVIDALALASKASGANSTVMIRGESGTGKELIAEGIHYSSNNKNGPFIRVNCAAIPETLIESELFGHEKGAFTGALKKKLGKFELANNGTIFLDEISELGLNLQAKILRVIQTKEIEPLGSEKTTRVNVRIIAATHRNLEKMIEEGSFREDLYYRLNVIPIILPPLRERREDIPLLSEFFFEQFNKEKKLKGITKEAMTLLSKYDWPGNVRELQNLIERMVVLGDEDDYITESNLPMHIREIEKSKLVSKESNNEIAYEKNKQDFIGEDEELRSWEFYEKLIIEKALKKHNSYNSAAKALGINHKTVASKANKYGLEKNIYWGKKWRLKSR